jgi:hypothetical protein
MKEKKQNWYTNQRKYHFIYKTTNLVNNKFYYGMHSTDNLDDGYIGSGTRLWNSIKKHGRDNFKLEILEFVESRELLKKREAELINEEMLKDPMCMNLKVGGEGGWYLSPKQYSLRNGKCGKSGGLVTIKLLHNSPNWKEMHARSTETRRQNGSISSLGMLGKTHSNETKEKMSELHKGSANSQYGSCWLFSIEEKKSIKVKLIDIDHYLQIGWQRGRKITW